MLITHFQQPLLPLLHQRLPIQPIEHLIDHILLIFLLILLKPRHQTHCPLIHNLSRTISPKITHSVTLDPSALDRVHHAHVWSALQMVAGKHLDLAALGWWLRGVRGVFGGRRWVGLGDSGFQNCVLWSLLILLADDGLMSRSCYNGSHKRRLLERDGVQGAWNWDIIGEAIISGLRWLFRYVQNALCFLRWKFWLHYIPRISKISWTVNN